MAQNPQQARLIRTAREVNDHKPEWVIEQVKAQVADCLNATNKRASELTIACFGLAFKPNIDDLRESPAMEIAAQIARWHSGTTQVVEPNIHALPKKLEGLCTLATLDAALASADVLVMLVDHNEFKAVSGDSVTRRISSTPKECGGENHSGHRRRGLHWFGGSAGYYPAHRRSRGGGG